MFCGIKNTTRVRLLSLGIDTAPPPIVLPFVYCLVDDTLFEVSPEILCSDVSSRYCSYENHTTGSSLLKTYYRSQWRIE